MNCISLSASAIFCSPIIKLRLVFQLAIVLFIIVFIFENKKDIHLRMSNAETLKNSAKVFTTSILVVPWFSMRRIFRALYPISSAKTSCVRLFFSLNVLIVCPIRRELIVFFIPLSSLGFITEEICVYI